MTEEVFVAGVVRVYPVASIAVTKDSFVPINLFLGKSTQFRL